MLEWAPFGEMCKNLLKYIRDSPTLLHSLTPLLYIQGARIQQGLQAVTLKNGVSAFCPGWLVVTSRVTEPCLWKVAMFALGAMFYSKFCLQKLKRQRAGNSTLENTCMNCLASAW